MSNKRNHKTNKTLTQDQRALLLSIKPKPFEYKSDEEATVVWSRLKSECVLLKKESEVM
jgi:hypothetical protein